MKKKWSKIAFVFYMIFSFVLTSLTPVSAYTTYQYLGSITDTRGTYGWAKVGNFLIDGRQAFCLEHNLPTPPNGSSFVEETYLDERFKKALYYGYDGIEPWSGFKSKENGIVVTTLALSVIYSGWDSIGGKNQGNEELGVNAFLNYIDSKSLKSREISFEPEKVVARLENDHQVTDSIKMKGDNEVSFTLPKNVTMIKDGKRYADHVTIKGGESFYFEAPLDVTGKYDSGLIKGNMVDYQPFVLRNKNQNLQDLGVLKVLKDPGYCASFSVEWLSMGALSLKKVDEQKNSVANVTFNVSYQEDMQNSLGTYTTNEEGMLEIPNLKPGLIYLQEISAPSHLVVDSGVFSCLIEAGKKTTFTKENKIKKGRIKIVKKDASNKQNILANTTFDIYQNDKLIETITTNDQGVALSSLLPYGKYEVIEKAAPQGYLLNGKKHPVMISENESVIEVEVLNERLNASIEINKAYLYPDIGHGDAKLYGAQYSLYAASDLYDPCTKELLFKKDELLSIKDYWGDVGTKEVDKNGTIQWDNLILGDYYVKETKAPEGFLIDETIHYFHLDGKKTRDKKSVSDQIMRQELGVLKISTDGSSGQAEVIAGVEFEIKLKSDIEKYGYEKAKVYAHLITDQKGMATFSLPYGIYNVRETKTREDLQPCDDFDLIVNKHSEKLEVVKIVNNGPYEAYVKIIKKDENSGKVIELEGVSFKIKDIKNDCYVKQRVGSQIIDTFITDKTGTVTTPLPLKGGDYEIVEITAPKNYVILDHSIPFRINRLENQNENVLEVEVEVKNKPIKGQISISKKGEVVQGLKKDFIYETKPLKDATFAIIAKKDIIDSADGKTILYHHGQIVEKLITDSKGQATSSLLPLGIYEIKEIKAPSGFELDEKSYEIELKADNNKDEVVYSSLELENVRKKLTIEIYKEDALNHQALDEATFGLYASEDMEGVFKKDQLLQTLKTKDGKATVSLDLPIATYYVKEISAPQGYLSKDEIWQIDGHLDVYYKHTFLNEPTKVYISKIDAKTKEPLENAKLQVSDLEGNIIDTWMSSQSKHLIKGLELNKTYKLEELEAPYGYELATGVEFIVKENEMVIELENKKIEGQVEIVKKGLVYDHYQDNQFKYELGLLNDVQFGLFNKDGVLLDKKITEDGRVVFNHLGVGDYYIQELKTVDGMVLDTHKYPFTVGKQTKFEFEIINKRTKIQLSLKKILEIQNQNHEESYKDVEFGIYTNEIIHDLPKDSLVGTSKINKEGHLVETFYLENGNYYLKEINTHIDYVLDENKYPFSVDLKDFNQEKQTIIINDGKDIENNLKEGAIVIEKMDENTKEYLSGAVFSLCDVDGYEWARVVTDENGMAHIPCPYGKYILKEVEAPSGYVLDEKVHEICVDDDQCVVKISLYNKKDTIVNSGDAKHPSLYGLVCMISLCLIYLFAKKRSKVH